VARATLRVPLAVGIIVVCPIRRGPLLIRGTRAIIQLQLTIIQRKVDSVTARLQLFTDRYGSADGQFARAVS